MNDSFDRRYHSRYPANHLRVLVKSLRKQPPDDQSLDNQSREKQSPDAPEEEWEKGLISSVDFNRYGIGLETEQNYAIGDILLMLIRTDDSTIAEVNGLVCNRSQTPFGYRLGVRFEHEGCEQETAADAVINIKEEILMIERQAAVFVH